MFLTRYFKGRPRGWPADKELYVCASRYNEEKYKMNNIKTWASCLPDEVRDKDYEMDLFEAPRKMKKFPSPIAYLLKPDAKETDEMPKPEWGAENAPPKIGAAHKLPRDPKVSVQMSLTTLKQSPDNTGDTGLPTSRTHTHSTATTSSSSTTSPNIKYVYPARQQYILSYAVPCYHCTLNERTLRCHPSTNDHAHLIHSFAPAAIWHTLCVSSRTANAPDKCADCALSTCDTTKLVHCPSRCCSSVDVSATSHDPCGNVLVRLL
ncbi:hypothetical protein LTR28_009765 [Elasticomyces elasticus]|nr:hypothetical protein LTR28_009765 [Elasticomyces elasticus]